MNDKRNPLHGSPASLPDHASSMTPVDIPGGVRTDFPDGSHLIESPAGEKYLISELGDISGNVPVIRRVQIEDLSRVLRHEIAQVYETTSHTLHFAGGGVFSYMHRRGGSGISIESRNILFRTLPDGVIIVCGTCREELDRAR